MTSVSDIAPVFFQEWNGTGRPPVGTVCEMKFDRWAVWEPTVVLCYGVNRVFVRQSGYEVVRDLADAKFRKLRTGEEGEARIREEMIREMTEQVFPVISESARVIAAALYERGYRKMEGEQTA